MLEGVDLGKQRRAVRVDEHATVGAGRQEPGAHGRPFALMPRKDNDVQPRNVRNPLPRQICRAVTRAIVGHEDLDRPASITRPRGDLVDRPA